MTADTPTETVDTPEIESLSTLIDLVDLADRFEAAEIGLETGIRSALTAGYSVSGISAVTGISAYRIGSIRDKRIDRIQVVRSIKIEHPAA